MIVHAALREACIAQQPLERRTVGEAENVVALRGAGRRRGAPGTICTYGPKHDSMTVAYVTDGYRFPPRGTQSGGDAAASEPYLIRTDGAREPLDPITQIELQPGELVEHRLSGGGGYGDPLERPLDEVKNDVRQGYVTAAAARELYGVVIDAETFAIDAAATQQLRATRRAAAGRVGKRA